MSTTDVECFQGKIFYNSDCSAVIIDPHEQNAKDEKKSNQTQPSPPIIHTFRVVTASDVEKNSDLQKTNPQKPILMCFICKLSFGNVQIFQQHSNSEHGVHLQKTEQILLAREFSSAIIQRNGQESPQISFLEPIVMEDNKEENKAATTVATNFLSLAAISNIFQYSHQKSILGVCHEHGNVKGNDCKTCELGSLRTSPSSTTSSFTIGACPEHVSGRPLGVECSRCELILSTSRLTTNVQTMSSTRNSCKTLKCPQCNWHYKYQETLEIHMREKHPDGESACGYCLAAQPHPRLARGESYTCGYKPYRCEICNYSTTTKGNLSIHMQSDKHLNNLQELNTSQNMNLTLNGPQPSNIPPAPPPPVSAVVSQSTPTPTPISTQASSSKPKPNFRCDVCSYETSVARNLRIHMTSEKHTHNISVLQSNMKHFQTLNMIQQQQLSNMLPENFGGSGLLPEAAIADMAYNQAIMLQLLQTSNQRNNEHLEISEAEQGLNPETLEPPFTLDLNPISIFTCLICENFHSNTLEDLNNHLLTDRSRPHTPSANDIMLVMNNNYICRLCNYKTNLKANYQLHSKTDKHLQKLNYINHIKEGGSRTEHKLNFPNSTSVQLKCNACEFYTNSMQKLTLHCGNGKHDKMEFFLKYIIKGMSNEQSHTSNLICKICDFTSENLIGLMRHLRSGIHSMENFDEMTKIFDWQSEQRPTEHSDKINSIQSSLEVDISEENGNVGDDVEEIVLKCNNCEFFASTKPEMETHIDNYHENCPENYYLSIPTNPGALKAFQAALAFAAVAAQTSPTPKKPKMERKCLCPLCESAFCQKVELEEHLVTVHSVNNSESVNRLLKMLEENSHSISSSHIVSEKHVYKYRCKQCSLAFKTEEKLTNHSLYHTMRDATKCFLCHRTFRTTLALQKHMELHDKEKEGVLEEDSVLESQNQIDQEISSNVSNVTQTTSTLVSTIPQGQLSQSNSNAFNQTQSQLDVLSLMHFHHQLMSLNFMNLAPPLSFGSSNLSSNNNNANSNNAIPNNADGIAVNLAKPVVLATSSESSDILPNVQGNNQKRARTRITDDQLKILRAHFDINNSPSEESILEMSKKANLPMKVVKHWFRNTLFKERQRNKDSPYNFANPPSTTLNLEEYERTGQATSNISQKSPDESTRNSTPHQQPSQDITIVNEQEPDNSVLPIDNLGIKVEPMEHEFPANSSETENRSESESSEREIISRPQTPGYGDFLGPENVHQMGPPKNFSGSNSSSNSPAGGKRANRTRFTDYQIKVLQEFFENNSYPKDSDLEYLSKLLLLSPRVIVVWFQNARQKQRKIYENQPNSTFFENDEKKSSTNINYSCKKCNLIFQRYYELIRHQKNHCFKEENNKKSAKAKIAAAQVAQSLSSEDSNSPAVDASFEETMDLSQPSRKRKLSESAGDTRYDFLYNYYLKNSVGASSGVGDKTLEFLIQFYQFNESKKFFHLDASPHLERTPSPQPQLNVIPPQNIIQPQISNTPNSSISSSQDFYESPMSSPTTIETTISVVEGGQGHNQNQAIQLSHPQIQNNHKRLRTTILPDQLNLLYECYQTESNPSRKMLEEISKKVNLKKRVVQVWFQNARAKDKKSRNNRFADESGQTQNSNITASSTPPANMTLVRDLMTNTNDKCMVNGVFNHFYLNVPQVAATNSSEEEEGDKIEEKTKPANSSSVYPYYNNYDNNRTEAGSIY